MDDVGACREWNIMVFIQQFCANGIKVACFGAVFFLRISKTNCSVTGVNVAVSWSG